MVKENKKLCSFFYAWINPKKNSQIHIKHSQNIAETIDLFVVYFLMHLVIDEVYLVNYIIKLYMHTQQTHNWNTICRVKSRWIQYFHTLLFRSDVKNRIKWVCCFQHFSLLAFEFISSQARMSIKCSTSWRGGRERHTSLQILTTRARICSIRLLTQFTQSTQFRLISTEPNKFCDL